MRYLIALSQQAQQQSILLLTMTTATDKECSGIRLGIFGKYKNEFESKP